MPGGLIALPVVERWRAMLNASKGRNFIRTGFPRSDISFKNLSRAFSSDGVRYCWLWAFCSFERRPCARWWRVEGGTLLGFDMVSYVRGSSGRKASARALLARSLITYCGDGDGARTIKRQFKASESRHVANLLIETSRRTPHFV